MKVITEEDLIPPHKIPLYQYRNLWFRGPMRKRLRALYKKSHAAYIAAYQPAKPDFCSEQEYGMKVFRTCVRTIMNNHWGMAGQAALLKSVNTLKTRSSTSDPSKVDGTLDLDFTELPVLISMDVEGQASDPSHPSELGIATLDLRELCGQKAGWPVIHSTNYILSRHPSRRKFLFDSSQRIDGQDTAKLRDVISNHLSIPDPLTQEATYRPVILVGHGVAQEILCLEELSLPLDALPTVVGTVDTNHFASKVISQRLSLERLIDFVGIPLHRSAYGGADYLHCAGNDANYTLRALLALLEIKSRDSEDAPALEALGRLARENIPVAAPGLEERWENIGDVGLAGTFFDEDSNFSEPDM